MDGVNFPGQGKVQNPPQIILVAHGVWKENSIQQQRSEVYVMNRCTPVVVPRKLQK